MDIIKIAITGIVSVCMAVLMKDLKPQFSVLLSISACILIFYFALSKLNAIAAVFSGVTGYMNLKESYLKILLKIIGISYISDFSASICRDAGYCAIAGQIEIFGKISILTVSTPVVLAMLETVTGYLG
ncbi:MAG: SpoIIIAC/SpoIIIAD family protein [Muricoprocola sp.]